MSPATLSNAPVTEVPEVTCVRVPTESIVGDAID